MLLASDVCPVGTPNSAATMQLGEDARARRRTYRRSQTLATLPAYHQLNAVLVHHQPRTFSTRCSVDSVEHRPSRAVDRSSSWRAATAAAAPTHAGDEPDGQRIRPCAVQPRLAQSRASAPDRFMHQQHVDVVSTTERKHSGGGGHRSSQTRRLGRTPSSPSVLFSRVKERIREKVFETSAEWPHLAAIVQERRQRAADAFEARMTSMIQQQSMDADDGLDEVGQTNSAARRRVRIRSDPVASHHHRTPSSGSTAGTPSGTTGTSSGVGDLFDRDGARSAFRRRSISEDTYNRQPGATARGSGPGGVVCSNDDLRAIVYEHKQRRSPVPVKSQQKANSLETTVQVHSVESKQVS